jgi:hypothetical protein
MKLRKGSSSEDMLLADEGILMVSAKNPAMSMLRLTGSFCLSSGKAEDLFPVDPVNPVGQALLNLVLTGFTGFKENLISHPLA